MADAKRGRRRTGSIEWKKKGAVARVTVDVDGVAVQKRFDLETKDPQAAALKLKRLLKEAPTATREAAAAPVTIADFAEQWLTLRETGPRRKAAASYERRYFERIWKPAFGNRTFDSVRKAEAQKILDRMATGQIMPLPRREGHVPEPYGYQSILHAKATAFRLWKAAMSEELAIRNVIELLEMPDLERETKARAILTDPEAVQLLEHPDVDPEIKVLFLLSRTVGGLRSGDLNSLDWQAFSPGFQVCTFVRRKTRKKIHLPEHHVVPEAVRAFLDVWHERHGRPASGPVFPVRRGPRAGQAKKASNMSYADRLRRELLKAGVTRHELHHETPTTKPCDFHSTRRAFATAGVGAGMTEQQIMSVGGWSDSKLVTRYKDKLAPKALPAVAALPDLAAGHADLLRRREPEKKRGPR